MVLSLEVSLREEDDSTVPELADGFDRVEASINVVEEVQQSLQCQY